MAWQSTRTVIHEYTLVAANDWIIDNFKSVTTGMRIPSPPIKTAHGEFNLVLTVNPAGKTFLTLERPESGEGAYLHLTVLFNCEQLVFEYIGDRYRPSFSVKYNLEQLKRLLVDDNSDYALIEVLIKEMRIKNDEVDSIKSISSTKSEQISLSPSRKLSKLIMKKLKMN
ncbi:hypothetical protein HDE_00259 [Halotydeus destructor]|nr:hypothetical protein HDE_00259 [Halotydeus destructor]